MNGVADRPSLLLFLVSADHMHRDAACATLAWLAEAEGSLFECYYDSPHTGAHFSGLPGFYDPNDLRGGTVVGGHPLEAFYLLLQRFRCQAACLGPVMLEGPLQDAGVPIRSCAGDITTFYREVFATSTVLWPDTVLVIGDGGCPQGISLTPFAFPEVVHRRALAIADGDDRALSRLASGRSVEGVWVAPGRYAAWRAAGYPVRNGSVFSTGRSVADETASMADRWRDRAEGFILGDPELIGRMIPMAARRRWLPLYGIPQADVVSQMAHALATKPVVYGRHQHDQDFFQLSRLGVAFHTLDPGRPPFPVIREAAGRWPAAKAHRDDPPVEELRRWAREGRILTTLLFWTGVIGHLENLYPLTEVLALTGSSAGLIVTTESFFYMPYPPLSLVQVPREAGGLFPRVDLLLADAGVGVMIEAEAPPARFARTLKQSVDDLANHLGDRQLVPKGWWGTMDAVMRRRRRPIISRYPDPPRFRIRYSPRPWSMDGRSAASGAAKRRSSLRSLIRQTALRRFFEPLRPYDGYQPGRPGRAVLEAVRDAGFEYAFTKAAYGPAPKVVSGIDGLTVLNYTAGRWDGWTPFVTINSLADLQDAERRLLRRRRPGWLVSTLDSCLWTFTGPIWERGRDLQAICRWAAAGGSSGRLINVTPGTLARYAAILQEEGMVELVDAE